MLGNSLSAPRQGSVIETFRGLQLVVLIEANKESAVGLRVVQFIILCLGDLAIAVVVLVVVR